MTLDEMLAREAIRYTLELYNRNADNADYERHREVFHPEAVLDVQGMGEVKGPEAIITWLKPGAVKRGAFEPGNFQRHNLTTTMIEFTDEGMATVVTYIIVVTELGFDHAGRYDDIFVKSGERWLIMRRRARMEWSIPNSRFTRWLGKGEPVVSTGR
jgi:hypothetical protein